MAYSFVLVVEADRNLRQSMALVLECAGYLVTATSDAREASEQIRSGKYHLVILDALMPETNQVLLPKTLGLYPYPSIVILSDKPLSEIESEGKLLSAQYLVKPIAPERLLDCVRTLLGQKAGSMIRLKDQKPRSAPPAGNGSG
jgi:DNA-binding response OmpR family regulator